MSIAVRFAHLGLAMAASFVAAGSAVWSPATLARGTTPVDIPNPGEVVFGDPPAAELSGPPAFVPFESGHVRPLARMDDLLVVVNTPDNRLEVYEIDQITGQVLESSDRRASVPVGMEPVAVSINGTQAWVTNHLSDSVSIVDLSFNPPAVRRTLLVGDEPRDIVFAGPNQQYAFITTAHRGQHRSHASVDGQPGAGDPQLLEPGIGRADVWVFDTTSLDQGALPPTLGGVPLGIVELFGDTPRALAVSPDGATVYAAVFHSGNASTTVHEEGVVDGFENAPPQSTVDTTGTLDDGFLDVPGGLPGPAQNAGTPVMNAPETGLIVKYNPQLEQWVDEADRDWSDFIRFELPDYDVFAIDAANLDPQNLQAQAQWSGVGSVLFNMAVDTDGTVYVSNTEANNLVRFEGEGLSSGKTPPSVQGHTHETRITLLEGSAVKPRHLNRHIDYSCTPVEPPCAPAVAPGSPAHFNGVREHSLALPTQLALSDDGRLFMAAMGSGKVAVLPTATLRDDAAWSTPWPGGFDPSTASAEYLSVTGGGPSGLLFSIYEVTPGELSRYLYVTTRFDNGFSVFDLQSGQEVQHVRMFTPEPFEIVFGRPVLYDAIRSSSNGENACASCHVFGDLDSLAWDLGDPDGDAPDSPIPIVNVEDAGAFHPTKGPMTTQTLRGMANHGAMHWRGDRAVGAFGSDPFDSELSFLNFLPAFEGLLGLEHELAHADMQRFADFMLAVQLPPNPVRAIDNVLSDSQALGSSLFFGIDGDGLSRLTDGQNVCNDCHTLDPLNGFYGTGGLMSNEGFPQFFKIAHLRNLYQKVGMFGMVHVQDMFQPVQLDDNGDFESEIVTDMPLGPQIRGFGYLHDGSVDNVLRFLHSSAFRFIQSPGGQKRGLEDLAERLAIADFMLAFDSDLAPMTGQQATYSINNAANSVNRLVAMLASSRAPFESKYLGGVSPGECEIIVKARVGHTYRGAWYDWSVPSEDPAIFLRDDGVYVSEFEVLAIGNTPTQELTFTCVPPGSGKRMGVDRDSDGCLDFLDDAPSNPKRGCSL